MSITLRKKAIKNGRHSLYLDYYLEGERKYEFLRQYIFTKPKDDLEKQHNKEAKKLAESIRSKREIEMNQAEHGFAPKTAKNINFLTYYDRFVETYPKKDKRLAHASLQYFKTFIGKQELKPADLTEQLCIDFKEYLSQRLNGETPANYFAKFKKMLRQAVREKVLAVNPALEVYNKKSPGLKKDVLDTDEIQTLANTHCGNAEVKRAFLFACLTGLRYCDIKEVTWGHINNQNLKINQAKTGRPVIINLNPSAQQLLGEPGPKEMKIFTLPSHTGILKVLRNWATRAKVQKHITFHVARHSFATNLIIYHTDINSVSALLGHSTLAHTQKYVRVVEALKEQAVNRLPELKF